MAEAIMAEAEVAEAAGTRNTGETALGEVRPPRNISVPDTNGLRRNLARSALVIADTNFGSFLKILSVWCRTSGGRT